MFNAMLLSLGLIDGIMSEEKFTAQKHDLTMYNLEMLILISEVNYGEPRVLK